MTEEIAVYKENQTELATGNEMYFDLEKFDQAQRVAKMLSSSTMVPDHFRNNVGNCMIGLNFAGRVGLDPFMVLQKMYIIKGRPGIESQLMIALINKSGRFSPLKFRLSGEGKQRQCACYATEIKSGETCEQTVTWAMVDAEGWNKKPGSKWNTMPDLMFQYRAAAFFGRLFCPEVLLGMMTKEELYDIDTPPPATISNLSDKLKSTIQPPEDTTKKEMKFVAESKQKNLLHSTPEWGKWIEIKTGFPEIVEGWQDPADTSQCIQATKQAKKIIDQGNV